MEENINKYIELLLKKCLNFDKSKSLFISYDVVNKDFVDKVIEYAKTMGITDIAVDEEDINITHDKLINESLEEIEKDPYFDKSNWDTYAKKNASFLMIETEFPHIMDDVSSEKLARAKYINRTTREIFRKKEATYEIPWTIAAYPNKIWADDIFGKSDNAYNKLLNTIFKICMVDTENPIKSWNDYLENNSVLVNKLNDLKIKKLHYKNSLGTNLYIELPDDNIWMNALGDKNLNMFVNMPSYEIFTSPDYRKTEGVVYSSRPLVYGGGLIDKFHISFKDGKVSSYDALVGKDILKGIIESDNNSCFLGEVALVNYSSPISNTYLVFKTTLIDENASCHLALGDGFNDCIKDGLKMSDEELLKRGINRSKQHVDFMIGTRDLEIEAILKDGREISIFKDGNFNI